MMDLQRIAVSRLFIWSLFVVSIVNGNVVFRVEHKFKGRRAGSMNLSKFRAHDARRHGRTLAAVDVPLGGDGNPSDTGLYFTKIQLGSPPKDYYVQVDTGSDLLWVNCVGCEKCPVQSKLGIKLSFYDPKGSSSSHLVGCDDSQCTMIYSSSFDNCKPDVLCYYQITYGDSSTTSGYFVEDEFHYDMMTGNSQITKRNSSIVFGCGAKQGGGLSQSNDQALDGIMGFGQANSSTISQLAAAKKVKKVFSHCLDGRNGGGIFAIGEVVEPKMNTTPILSHMQHYNVLMLRMEVDGNVMKLGSGRPSIIDSGTTLTYLPDDMFERLMNVLISKQPDLDFNTVEEQFKCFQYSGDVDDGFPPVKFHFDDSLTMTIYPHEYLFSLQSDVWCFGWMNSGITDQNGSDVVLLGDLVLNNKLVLYDSVKNAIGWTEYNCSSSIKVKDAETGAVYSVGAQDISAATTLLSLRSLCLTCLLALISTLYAINY